MTKVFDTELAELKERLLYMGGLVELMINLSIKSLVERNEDLGKDLYRQEDEVNRLQMEIDDRCIKLIALNQPAGSDLRFITSAMKINSELERMGDQAVNIIGAAKELLKFPQLKRLADIVLMANITKTMTKDCLDAFVRTDVGLAREVLLRDDKVDGLKDQIFRVLLTYMLAETRHIPVALELILISRHLERIGDHATNIAEDVIFLAEGRDVRHHGQENSAI